MKLMKCRCNISYIEYTYLSAAEFTNQCSSWTVLTGMLLFKSFLKFCSAAIWTWDQTKITSFHVSLAVDEKKHIIHDNNKSMSGV